MVRCVQINVVKMKIIKYVSKMIIWLMGWKIVGTFPDVPKMIVVLAPHRKGAFEVIMGLLVSYACEMQGRSVLVKEEAFKNPSVAWFLKKIGAIATKRNVSMKSGHVSQVESIVDEISAAQYITLVITPEGTRIKKDNPNPSWKTGFYFIAHEADIPYLCVAWDYNKKQVIFNDKGPVHTSLDMFRGHRDDMRKIMWWYSQTIPGYRPNIDLERFSRRTSDTEWS